MNTKKICHRSPLLEVEHMSTDPLSVLLIENEKWSFELMKGYISQLENLALKDSTGDGLEALSLLKKNRYDLVFSSITPTGMNAFKILESLSYIPNVVIITLKKEYALKAFDMGVFDYLLKPVSFQRFEKSMNRFSQLKSSNEVRTGDDSDSKEHRNLLEVLQVDYLLTPQETTICQFLHEGYGRDDILTILNITRQTLKQHLRVIYSKTIDVDNINPNKSHGKLHMLLNFLRKLSGVKVEK